MEPNPVPFGNRKIFFPELVLLFNTNSPLFVNRSSTTEIRLCGILLYKFRPLQDTIMMQIGHIGLFCNPKILLNFFMFCGFEDSSPFLYCPVSLYL